MFAWWQDNGTVTLINSTVYDNTGGYYGEGGGLYNLGNLLLQNTSLSGNAPDDLVNGATATLLLALAFAATAGGEFVREGSRKPFTVRQVLYANSITPDEVASLRTRGSVTDDPYPLRGGEALPNDQVRLGARVYRFQCSVCHTLEGANGVVHLTATWTTEQTRLNLAQLQRTKPFMPPFAGSPEELEALVQFLRWSSASRPAKWVTADDPAVIERIRVWIERADIRAGDV